MSSAMTPDLPDELWRLIFYEAVTVQPYETVISGHISWLHGIHSSGWRWPETEWERSLPTRLAIINVSKRWYKIGIELLYHTIHFPPYANRNDPDMSDDFRLRIKHQNRQILNQLKENDDLRVLVRRLEANTAAQWEPSIELEPFPNLIAYDGFYKTTLRLSSPSTIRNLRFLKIHLVKIQHTIDLLQALAGSTSLEILQLTTADADHVEEEVPFITLELPRLVALRMECHFFHRRSSGIWVDIFEIIPKLRLPTIKSLDISRWDGIGSIERPHWLIQLEDLKLTLSTQHGLHEFLEKTPFSHLHQLGLNMKPGDGIALLPQVFNSSHIRSISHIYIDLRWCGSPYEWEIARAPLEAAMQLLLDRTRFPSLRIVNIQHRSDFDYMTKSFIPLIVGFLLRLDRAMREIGVTLESWKKGIPVPFVDIIPQESKENLTKETMGPRHGRDGWFDIFESSFDEKSDKKRFKVKRPQLVKVHEALWGPINSDIGDDTTQDTFSGLGERVSLLTTLKLLFSAVGVGFQIAEKEGESDKSLWAQMDWKLPNEEWFGVQIRTLCGVPLKRNARSKAAK